MSHLSARVVPAYAKLNLSLSVIGRRADGFHDIDSILVPIDWHDLVAVSIALAATESVALQVTGPAAAGVPTGDSNLAVRAARALIELAGRPLDVRLWLDKSVPHGAGLGGGSGDAAAVLRAGTAALAALGIATDPDEVAAAALAIGSDVPALLDLGAHRVRGRGERLEQLRTPRLNVAIVSTVPSSTAATYGALLPDGASATTGGRRDSPSCSRHQARDRAAWMAYWGARLKSRRAGRIRRWPPLCSGPGPRTPRSNGI